MRLFVADQRLEGERAARPARLAARSIHTFAVLASPMTVTPTATAGLNTPPDTPPTASAPVGP